MKLQPNFSWQSYEGKPEEQQKQFYYQLQQQHIATANAINSTIDDVSFFTAERMTSETWIDGKPIWTKSFQTTLSVAGINNITHGIVGMETVVFLGGSAQDAIPFTAFAVPIPYTDVVAIANQIKISTTQTTISITISGATWQNYIASVTIKYTKV